MSINLLAWPEFAETWIENWPIEVAALSFRRQGVRLERLEAHALGRRNGVHHHSFAADTEQALVPLEARMDAAVRQFVGGSFIRMGSRSPKDTPLGLLTQCRACNGREALSLLTSGSRRISYDLRTCLRAGYSPWVFASEWVPMLPESEFRCFMRRRQLVGVSQYHHRSSFPWLLSGERHAGLASALVGFAAGFARVSHLDDVVLDVIVELLAGSVKLIELNPMHTVTDPCLFSWGRGDLDGTLRLRGVEGIIKLPLPV